MMPNKVSFGSSRSGIKPDTNTGGKFSSESLQAVQNTRRRASQGSPHRQNQKNNVIRHSTRIQINRHITIIENQTPASTILTSHQRRRLHSLLKAQPRQHDCITRDIVATHRDARHLARKRLLAYVHPSPQSGVPILDRPLHGIHAPRFPLFPACKHIELRPTIEMIVRDKHRPIRCIQRPNHCRGRTRLRLDKRLHNTSLALTKDQVLLLNRVARRIYFQN